MQRVCKSCGQPILSKGQIRDNPHDYRHASGCPLDDVTPEALSGFTTFELLGELSRRETAIHYSKLKDVGKDWYFDLADNDDEDDDCVSFNIVHKRYWHENHCLADWTLDIDMPDGFFESMESVYNFEEGSKEDGERILLDHGFTKLPTMGSALIVQVFSTTQPEKRWRVDLQADTESIKGTIRSAMDKMPEFRHPDPVPFDSFDGYRTWMLSLAKSIGCIVKWRNEDGCCSAFMMDEKLYESLPQESVDDD